ncbi:hypothetical protein ASF98_20355 [Arthrobacter sp. Leaf337]|uniref:hypothetical protein n=1 Tax=Arthrobacter sp. Leaf337 TaxID=1736342 RepID=UPI0006FE3557|nr:hypothetical protein [Arthrobacter sp. Leaf337]KQR79818.1 hypothetical protein ASF98_20355 [Arthrobacter sp. Leaf337]
MPQFAGSLSLPVSRRLRAALFLGVLAILAGFIGMHVIASAHTQHGPGALAASPAGAHATHAAAPSAAAHVAPDAMADGTVHAAALDPASARPMGSSAPEPPPSCVSTGETGDMAAPHASCIPAPATTVLSAPPPGTTSFTGPEPSVDTGRVLHAYTHMPGSPTPGELSISRT